MLYFISISTVLLASRVVGVDDPHKPSVISSIPHIYRSDTSSLWRPRDLAARVSVVMLNKQWKPHGVSGDEVVDEFAGDVNEAFHILTNSSDLYSYFQEPLGSAERLFAAAEGGVPAYDHQQDSIIIIHGMNGNPFRPFVRNTICALCMRNLQKKYNIFAFDIQKLNRNIKVTLMRSFLRRPPKFQPVALVLSSFIVKGVVGKQWRPGQIHLVGLSYSGHLMGYIARSIHLLFDEKLASIIALDPSNLGHQQNITTRDDARAVHFYHSNSMGRGTEARVATADFVFNDGNIQPECNLRHMTREHKAKFFKEDPWACSHNKIVPRFWYSVLYPSKFKTRRCASWSRFRNCLCDDNEEAVLAYPITTSSATGTYYIKTNDHHPYGMGDTGSKCKHDVKTAYEASRNEEIKYLEDLWKITI